MNKNQRILHSFFSINSWSIGFIDPNVCWYQNSFARYLLIKTFLGWDFTRWLLFPMAKVIELFFWDEWNSLSKKYCFNNCNDLFTKVELHSDALKRLCATVNIYVLFHSLDLLNIFNYKQIFCNLMRFYYGHTRGRIKKCFVNGCGIKRNSLMFTKCLSSFQFLF